MILTGIYIAASKNRFPVYRDDTEMLRKRGNYEIKYVEHCQSAFFLWSWTGNRWKSAGYLKQRKAGLRHQLCPCISWKRLYRMQRGRQYHQNPQYEAYASLWDHTGYLWLFWRLVSTAEKIYKRWQLSGSSQSLLACFPQSSRSVWRKQQGAGNH